MTHVQVVHHIPGRCRIHIDQLADDPDFADVLKQVVQAWKLAIDVRVNRAARSLIVAYDDNAITPSMAHTYLDDCVQRAEHLASTLELDQPQPVLGSEPLEKPVEPTDLTPLVNQWQDLGLPFLGLSLALLASPFELPAVLVTGVILAAAMPWTRRATDSLINHHQPNTDLLDSLWMGLNTLNGNYAAPALKACLVESRRTVRGIAGQTQDQALLETERDQQQQRLVTHLIQTDPVHDTQLGMAQATFMREAIVPTLLMGGAIFVVMGNLSAAIAPFQLDFGSGVPISIATTVRSALVVAVQRGIYVRSGRVLEKLAQVDTLVLDAKLLLSDVSEAASLKTTISTLQTQGISLYLLHDGSPHLERLAPPLGIPPTHILSAPSAAEQCNLIQAFQASGKQVAVVGDPYRCKSALACANVSVGQTRSGWAMEDVLAMPFDAMLLDQDWRRVSQGVEIAQRAFQRIYENTAIIVVPNLIVTGAGVFLGLNPVINVIVNNGSAFIAEFLNSKQPLFELEDGSEVNDQSAAVLSPLLEPAVL